MGGVLAAFAGGLGGAVQARVNGELGARLHDGLAAALLSNTTALLLVMLAGAGLRPVRTALRAGTLRPWECLGGACGAVYVASQGLSAAALGVAVFTVAVVTGQSGGGLAADRVGVGPGGPRPVTRARAVGALLTVVAVLVAVGGRPRTGTSVALAALPVAAGVALAVQGGLNGRVRQAAGAVRPAVLLNAVVGTAGLLVAFAVAVAVRGWPTGALPGQPWVYLGGPIGVCFVAIGVVVVRRIGVLLLGLGIIAGQIAGAVALDLVAPGPAGRPGVPALAGAALTLLAVVIAGRG